MDVLDLEPAGRPARFGQQEVDAAGFTIGHFGPVQVVARQFRNAAGRLAPVPFAERADIVKAFRSDARVLREWLGVA